MGSEVGMSNNGVMMQDALMSIDEKEEAFIDKDEVTIRRMKNRERQRRYRARKRMREEAGIDENLSFEITTTGQEHQQEEGEEGGEEEEDGEEEEEEELEGNNAYVVDDFVRRVYCVRDWKKEARRAHLIMDKSRDGSCLVNRKIRPRPRDWKAEARNVKA